MTTAPNNSWLTTLDLGGRWTLRLAGEHPASLGDPRDREAVPLKLRDRDISATVPGCVHTDLMAAGLIPDPYLADNELKVLWIGRCDWSYARDFQLAPAMAGREHVELCFDGLDTVAEVWLNRQKIASAADMHLRYRFDIKPLLRSGSNALEVRFAAPLPHAFAERDRLGDLPHTGNGSNPLLPHNFIRKMACSFGWDWGPVVPTSGIWRAVRIDAWDTARLGDIRPIVSEATTERAVVEVHADVVGDGRITATLTPPGGGREIASDGLRFKIPTPGLWWPAGHGPQPLYTLRVSLHDRSGNPLDAREHRIGLRTSRLVTEPDLEPVEGLGQGESMCLEINGKPIYCKGANWIPDDCFPSRIDRDRYRRRIEQALGANMNMLRVWGGGLYESDDFYEICDELGVMVWQDFLLACAAYSEEEPFRTLIAAEARDNVSRLGRHPSLVLWNGCNENFMGYDSWGYEGTTWRDYIGERGWGLSYYFDTFPAAVAELAPGTPYWPGSPYSNDPTLEKRSANANAFGNRHIWDVWHGPGHYRNYLAHFPRFASEFGFHGPPTWPTLERAVPADQRRWDSPIVRLHNKNGGGDQDGQRQTSERMADDFAVPDDFDDWLYLAQVMQARALTMGVGWFRALFPWNSGALYWQLNDCWPVFSWSAIDGEGRKKPLYFATRRFFAPRLVTIGPVAPLSINGWDDAGPLSVYLHNDSDDAWRATCRLRRMTLAGDVLGEHRLPVEIPPRSAERLMVPEEFRDRSDCFLMAEACGGERGFWWFASDKTLDYPDAQFDADVRTDGRRVTIRAHSLLRDLCLFPERLHPEAQVSDGCVTLLPGECFTFRIDAPEPLDRTDLVAPPVFQCVNRFGRRRGGSQ